MTCTPTIDTPRLHLRPWRDGDLPALAAMNADPIVMEFFPKALDQTESDALAARIRENFARRGFGLWAVVVPEVADFIGFVGLAVPGFSAHFIDHPALPDGHPLRRHVLYRIPRSGQVV